MLGVRDDFVVLSTAFLLGGGGGGVRDDFVVLSAAFLLGVGGVRDNFVAVSVKSILCLRRVKPEETLVEARSGSSLEYGIEQIHSNMHTCHTRPHVYIILPLESLNDQALFS